MNFCKGPEVINVRVLMSLCLFVVCAQIVCAQRPDVLPALDVPTEFDEVSRVTDVASALWQAVEDGSMTTTTMTLAEYAALGQSGEPPRLGLPEGKTWVWRQAEQGQRWNTPSGRLEPATVYAPSESESIVVRLPGVPNPRTLPRSIYSVSRITGLTIIPNPPDFWIINGVLIIKDREVLQRW